MMTGDYAPSIEIRALGISPDVVTALSAMLVETVALGGSVSFMYPLDEKTANAFWNDSLAAADRGERIVLGAFDGSTLAGTVTLILKSPPNQPHRAEVAKMITSNAHRGRGVATLLMRELERLAIGHGRTLLVLDTATDGGASGFYERLGFTLVGEIPGYALKPHGGFTGAKFYFKLI